MNNKSPTERANELYHHGIKGQKWGVRRFQNEDGNLTDAGEKRYGEQEPSNKKSGQPTDRRTAKKARKTVSENQLMTRDIAKSAILGASITAISNAIGQRTLFGKVDPVLVCKSALKGAVGGTVVGTAIGLGRKGTGYYWVQKMRTESRS